MLGPPNRTSATQEIDQGYTDLKQEFKKSSSPIVSIKLEECNAAQKQAGDAVTMSINDDNDNDDQDIIVILWRKSLYNITFGNEDLPHIVNEFSGDPIKLRPFDKVFTPENIKT